MEEALRLFKGKLCRIYTVSAVESYLGTVLDVKKEYFILKERYSKKEVYVANQFVEAIEEVREQSE